jgi:hypothetical protein
MITSITLGDMVIPIPLGPGDVETALGTLRPALWQGEMS